MRKSFSLMGGRTGISGRLSLRVECGESSPQRLKLRTLGHSALESRDFSAVLSRFGSQIELLHDSKHSSHASDPAASDDGDPLQGALIEANCRSRGNFRVERQDLTVLKKGKSELDCGRW